MGYHELMAKTETILLLRADADAETVTSWWPTVGLLILLFLLI